MNSIFQMLFSIRHLLRSAIIAVSSVFIIDKIAGKGDKMASNKEEEATDNDKIVANEDKEAADNDKIVGKVDKDTNNNDKMVPKADREETNSDENTANKVEELANLLGNTEKPGAVRKEEGDGNREHGIGRK